jgi:hypothetical protein
MEYEISGWFILFIWIFNDFSSCRSRMRVFLLNFPYTAQVLKSWKYYKALMNNIFWKSENDRFSIFLNCWNFNGFVYFLNFLSDVFKRNKVSSTFLYKQKDLYLMTSWKQKFQVYCWLSINMQIFLFVLQSFWVMFLVFQKPQEEYIIWF